MDRVKFIPNIDLGHIISVAIFLMGGLAAYYDLKGDVRIHTGQIATIQATLVEDRVNQHKADDDQDRARERAMLDLKGTMGENKQDIKEDLRSLKRDIGEINRKR